ncbi:glycosyltransferase family 4 protein [Aequorivita sp. F47161]|uniref:Glycosyltransferase family 4 protein n=1 Tax=Aequorivita vitellina TaxID=2874475 RepID=A0A9X1QWV8_9FLAO|nr:glycosyltransferase family 4 protein [Aequorivita vitellina]MCG2419775.1 glycosyltransferase family 4 protein [Aequorivita vitellina]
MKIIFLEAVHNFGGSSKSTLELAKRLIDEKNEVLVVDFWGCCEPYILQCKKENVPYQIIDPRNKPIMLNDKGRLNILINYIRYLKKNQEYKKNLQKIILEFKPDLISVNNTKTLAILKSSKSYKIAYFARTWFLPNTFGYVERRLLKKLADVFLAVSQATRQMVFASGYATLGNIYVIPNAIEINKIKPLLKTNEAVLPWHKVQDNSREFILMHCGSFRKIKGQLVVLEVLNKLIDKGEKVKLLLIGMVSHSVTSKNYYNSILEYINEHELEPYIDIVINESDVLAYYTMSDMLIHPSYSEGLPRVILEAMAFGKPVAANAVGGVTDFISDNYTGFLTNFNAVDEYVEVIQKLVNEKKQYEFISKNAYAMIKKNYTNKNQVRAFMKIEHRIDTIKE